MAKKNFVGTWKLVSFERVGDDSIAQYPYGRDAAGLVIYDAKGNMAVQLADVHRPSFASSDQWRGTSKELKSAVEGYSAYFGTYFVDEKKGIVTHHVLNSLFPNWTGSDQVRYFKFEADRLILSTPPIPFGGKTLIGKLIWERVSQR